MNSEMEECLRKIAGLNPEDIGNTEENVKQTVFVPILKCLGHHESQLDFEYAIGRRRVVLSKFFLPHICSSNKLSIIKTKLPKMISSHFL